jgi:hypothetical protein
MQAALAMALSCALAVPHNAVAVAASRPGFHLALYPLDRELQWPAEVLADAAVDQDDELCALVRPQSLGSSSGLYLRLLGGTHPSVLVQSTEPLEALDEVGLAKLQLQTNQSPLLSPSLRKRLQAAIDEARGLLLARAGHPGYGDCIPCSPPEVLYQGSATPDSVVKPPSARSLATKRLDYLCWDDYFMGVAWLSAMRSKGAWRVLDRSAGPR